MEITINGKKVDASKITLQDAVESIFGKQYDDIPDVYDSPEEYLVLAGLDLRSDKCNTKEKVADLSKKLKERLVWIEKHKNYNYKNIVDFLSNQTKQVLTSIEMLENSIAAHKLIIGYINSVTEKTKKK